MKSKSIKAKNKNGVVVITDDRGFVIDENGYATIDGKQIAKLPKEFRPKKNNPHHT